MERENRDAHLVASDHLVRHVQTAAFKLVSTGGGSRAGMAGLTLGGGIG